jgi:hypothetical protein
LSFVLQFWNFIARWGTQLRSSVNIPTDANALRNYRHNMKEDFFANGKSNTVLSSGFKM